MPDVLEFDPNRGLTFDPNRELGFSPGRGVQFNPSRDLGFHPDRDLGFGKRGVVFRGFVCPVCGAAAGEMDPVCTECGTVFEERPSSRLKAPMPPSAPPAVAPPVPSAPPKMSAPPAPAPAATRTPPPPPPPPVRMYPPTPKRIEVHNCPYCGARLSTTDAYCWNCGNRVYREGG